MKTSKCLNCASEIVYTGSRPKKWCNLKCRNAYRYRNEIRYKQRNTYEEQSKRGKQRKIKAIKIKGGACNRCGQTHPAALCFHHVDPSTKKFQLDGRIFGNLSWASIEMELVKCELLCLNCHNIEHNGSYWLEYL